MLYKPQRVSMQTTARVVGLFIISQALYSGLTYACSCDDISTEEAVDRSDQIFVGHVRRISSGCGQSERVRFEVEIGILGVEDGKNITIRDVECMQEFELDDRMLVFATNRRTGWCSGNAYNPSDDYVDRVISLVD